MSGDRFLVVGVYFLLVFACVFWGEVYSGGWGVLLKVVGSVFWSLLRGSREFNEFFRDIYSFVKEAVSDFK